MDEIFGKPILTQEEVRKRVRELGRQITLDYAQKDLLMIGILKGAFAFYADLARAIGLPLRVDFLVASSNDKKIKMTEDINILSALTEEVTGRDVLLVEDIVDSGRTVQYLKQMFSRRQPKSLKSDARSRSRWTMWALTSPTNSSSAMDWTISRNTVTFRI